MYLFSGVTPDAVSCGVGSHAMLTYPYAVAPLFANKAVGKGKK